MELMLVLLLLAGDIEINPGPLSPAPSNPPASVSNPIQHSGFQAYPPFWFPFPPVVSACPRCGLDVASPGGQMFPGLALVPVSAPGLPLMPGGSVAGAGELQGVPISVPLLCACTPFGVSNASSGDGVQLMPFESVEVAFGHGPFADPADLLRRGRTGAGCFAEVQMDPQKLFTGECATIPLAQDAPQATRHRKQHITHKDSKLRNPMWACPNGTCDCAFLLLNQIKRRLHFKLLPCPVAL
ncbi:hypothetical protein WMY93_015038 [Mugilogobius chulae]|uniref:Uncharacterized protein n=1 Tax=Mugilogobius chulae TaxID=88201 RepID=A0AAW0NYK6_9GOBI